ncbi:MAG: Gfo/Idh/MocA family oxidoreductase [Alphaproteobacteria bacterium]|nr:Gfo/Idh/MocA family oxidoreductase [Alphaproteobacteria bacterium]
MKKTTLALCGVGSFARRRILPIIDKIPQLELIEIIDPNFNLPETQEYSSVISYFSSFEKFCISGEAELVYITSPNYLHFYQTLKSLESGRHVLCEKPIAFSGIDCEILISKATKLSLHLSVGHMLRFSPAINFIKKILLEGKIGSVNRIEITFNYMLSKQSRSWAFSKSLSGGGCFIDAGVHCLDIIRFLTEGSFENLYAKFGYTAKDEVEREAKCSFTVSNVECFLDISSNKDYLTSLVITGSEGKIEIENFAATWGFINVKLSFNCNKGLPQNYFFDVSKTYINQLNSLLQNINSESFDYQIVKDAYENIKIIEQLYSKN